MKKTVFVCLFLLAACGPDQNALDSALANGYIQSMSGERGWTTLEITEPHDMGSEPFHVLVNAEKAVDVGDNTHEYWKIIVREECYESGICKQVVKKQQLEKPGFVGSHSSE